MEEFFKKYASHLDSGIAIDLVHHSIDCAKKHYEEGNKAESKKYLLEAGAMLSDLLSVMV